MTSPDADPDLLIIGGGPAGCAAALTAAGLGMRSLLIEAGPRLCGKLHHIPALNNVLGGFRTGPELADAITGDLSRGPPCRTLTGVRVTTIAPEHTGVTITLDNGDRCTAPHAVLATGVGPAQPADAPWITAPAELRLPPLWEAAPAESTGHTWLIVGADRPMGTFLRAYPTLDIKLLVAHPLADVYKIEEVAGDPRLTLLPVHSLTLRDTATAELHTTDGQRHTCRADAAFTNIGSVPTAPTGAIRDVDGYCPPSIQHPRLSTAGDLRSGSYQRIMTATGSGAEAALRAYYASRDDQPY